MGTGDQGLGTGERRGRIHHGVKEEDTEDTEEEGRRETGNYFGH